MIGSRPAGVTAPADGRPNQEVFRSSSFSRRMLAIETKQQRVNEQIRTSPVRVISAEGAQLGIMSTDEAIAAARRAGLDLVEVAPAEKPPVCRIMDFGKFKYQESKKQHEAKLKQKQVQVKEIKFRPGTDEGDYQIKLRNIVRFLGEGDKVKVTLRFRGREMAHQELGLAQLKRVEADVAEIAITESFPKMEGRQMVMVLAPKKKK